MNDCAGAEERTPSPTSDEIRMWFLEFLLDEVRHDRFPSSNHLDLIEECLPSTRFPEYVALLIDKVAADCFPSTDLLRRIERLVARRVRGC